MCKNDCSAATAGTLKLEDPNAEFMLIAVSKDDASNTQISVNGDPVNLSTGLLASMRQFPEVAQIVLAAAAAYAELLKRNQ